MPLLYAKIGEEYIIGRVGGTESVRLHLENLGFTVGTSLRVVSALAGNIIVHIKESRVALGEDLAGKILIR